MTNRVIPLRLAEVTTPDWHPTPNLVLPIYGYLVLRAGARPWLVDTGVGEGSAFIDEQYRPVRRPLAGALAEHGVAPGDIEAIVNTHLHFDHAGGNSAFPEVPIHVQAAEVAAAREPRYTIAEWVWFPGARYVEHAGDVELAPGLALVSAPGTRPDTSACLSRVWAGGR
ncbi:MAG: MBL fold metallo-hydrolase [Chloroflexi bacterium]|nr:MBL fold metallo-hydrolase [Chloroflexota bacterium]